jgi:Tol biopolymer transport system component
LVHSRYLQFAKKQVFLLLLICCGLALPLRADDAKRPALRIAFTSLRERPLYTVVYFYEHDGAKTGKIVGQVATQDSRSDHHPALSSNGEVCLIAAEVVAKVSTILRWNAGTNKTVPLPQLGKTPNALMAPSLTGNGKLLAFESWNRPGSPGRWDIVLFDLQNDSLVDVPNLNATRNDERKPALSQDGRWIAFTTNTADGAGRTDIRLYDRKAARVLTLPKLNSPYTDTEPSLSGDGRFIAFVSDRPRAGTTTAGTRDIYLYDRVDERLLPLPGLNSPAQEQSPSLTADGRYVAFVSERLNSVGERDIFVYDRRSGTLLPTPNLNSAMDEYDPCIIRIGGNVSDGE